MKKRKYQSFDRISREEFLKLFQGPLKKLFDYASTQKLVVRPLYSLINIAPRKLLEKVKCDVKHNIPYWAIERFTRSIFADIRDLEIGNRGKKITTLANFAHEIAHDEFRFKSWIDCKFYYNYACILEEYYCWKRGLEIIKRLKILIDDRSCWEYALKMIGTHSEFCPRFKNCNLIFSPYKVQTKHKESILFWRKQGPRRKVLKDYYAID